MYRMSPTSMQDLIVILHTVHIHIYIVHISGMSGVALPFRDLRQLMRNITYFASMA